MYTRYRHPSASLVELVRSPASVPSAAPRSIRTSCAALSNGTKLRAGARSNRPGLIVYAITVRPATIQSGLSRARQWQVKFEPGHVQTVVTLRAPAAGHLGDEPEAKSTVLAWRLRRGGMRRAVRDLDLRTLRSTLIRRPTLFGPAGPCTTLFVTSSLASSNAVCKAPRGCRRRQRRGRRARPWVHARSREGLSAVPLLPKRTFPSWSVLSQFVERETSDPARAPM